MSDQLTEREKWLMAQAWEEAKWHGGERDVEGEPLKCISWLTDIAADGGVTVEMVLAKEAPE